MKVSGKALLALVFCALSFAPILGAEVMDMNFQFVTVGTIDVSKVPAKPCGAYINVMGDPVNKDFQPDPGLYKIFAPTQEPCGDVETKHGWLYNRKLHIDQEIAIPLSGEGDLIIVACGNKFRTNRPLVGKYFQCPPEKQCPAPEVRTVTVEVCPGDMEKNAEGKCVCPRGTSLDQNGNCVYLPASVATAPPHRWFCFRGGWRSGTCIAAVLLAVGGAEIGHGNNNSCQVRHLPSPASTYQSTTNSVRTASCSPTTIRSVNILKIRF